MVNVSTSCQVASGLHVVGIEWFRFHALHLNTEQEGEEQWGIVLTMNGGRADGDEFRALRQPRGQMPRGFMKSCL